ncbi:MAG: hypothetical protein IPP76_04770 [Moraxellaceae bacterium]|nr:hypothetical protein [Moraxellaceae bacterium]
MPLQTGFKTDTQFIVRYSLIVPTAKLPIAVPNAKPDDDGTWKTVTGNDLLAKTVLPAEADFLLAARSARNSIRLIEKKMQHKQRCFSKIWLILCQQGAACDFVVVFDVSF